MSRPIVLSNGEMSIGINRFAMVHDFYFPYVGLENHAAGRNLRHRIGVWTDGAISWLDDGNWTFRFSYPHRALIGLTIAESPALGLRLEFEDAVDSQLSAFMRNIHVINLRSDRRDVRIFLHQAFIIGDGRSNTDTAQYLPDSNAILHYRGQRAFVVSGQTDGQPFDQYSVGLFGIEGREGTFRDADDGELSLSNVEHGRVDSTLRFKLEIDAHESKRVSYWIAAGTSTRRALFVHRRILEDGVPQRLEKTADWWHKWLETAAPMTERVPVEWRQSFETSLLIIKSHIDNRGAVIASTDTTMLNYSRDAYAYCWPRDGAYAIWPLVRLGFVDEAWNFFDFCRRNLHRSGYLMHKYRADGALGSSWHPYVHEDGSFGPPIQEDETALVLFLLAQFYKVRPDGKALHAFYNSLAVPMAEFLAGYIEPHTGLPRPSYDLWEEVYLTSTYTSSVVYAALLAAADMADAKNDADHAVSWRAAADDIRLSAHKYLFNQTKQSFYKGVLVKDGNITYNDQIDSSSVFGAFMFGLFDADSPEIKGAFEKLSVLNTPPNPGIARYENDNYYRADMTTPGNIWPICSLWLAQYYVEADAPDKAREIVDWVKDSAADETGILSEQINPRTGEAVSVAPLVWSHAEFVSTIIDMLADN